MRVRLVRTLAIALSLIFLGQNSLALAASLPTPQVANFADLEIPFGQISAMTISPPLSSSTGAWSLTSSNPLIARANGLIIQPVGVGTVIITGTQQPTATFTSITREFKLTITGLIPAIGPFPNMNYQIKSGSVNSIPLISPASPSTGIWVFASSNPKVAVVSGKSLTIVGAGTSTITANQGASGIYGPSAPISMVLTVTGLLQSSTPSPSPSFSSPSPTLTRSATPTSVPLATPTPTPTPSATITPTKSPTPSSSPTKSVPVVGVVSNKVISFGDSSITLVNPASNSPGTWSYVSSDPKIVSINGNVVEARAVGSATITATQSASGNFGSISKTFQILVNPGSPTLSWGIQTISASLKSRVISPPASPSHGLWSYQVSNPLLAKVIGGSIQGIKAGSTTITAVQAADGNYREVQVSTLLVVNPTVSVTVSGQVINVVVIGGVGTVTINGQPAKVGKNTVTSGAKVVKVFVDGKIYLSKGVQIL